VRYASLREIRGDGSEVSVLGSPTDHHEESHDEVQHLRSLSGRHWTWSRLLGRVSFRAAETNTVKRCGDSTNLVAQDLATYLDDIFHEFAKLGENVEVMPD
jgi:hypothetical protein